MTPPRLRLGIAGLGRGFMLMLPTLLAHPRVQVVAGTDPRDAARARFAVELGRAHASVQALCEDPGVDAVYIASPHEHHAEQAVIAARAGKHVLVEKPMALTLEACAAMIEAARGADVRLVVGHSHSFAAPYVRARALIDQGDVGRVRMIHALNCTDFIYRPRRPEELDHARGGGVVLNQGAHQVDVVRLLAGGRASSVRAHTAAWDAARPVEGAYSALLEFADGTFASLTYSGYAHFDSDELMGWIGETGEHKDAATHRRTRAALRQTDPVAEVALKTARTYGPAGVPGASTAGHHHFGMVLACCEHADLRPLPNGVMIYGDERAWLDPLAPPAVPRAEVVDELCDAVLLGRVPLHTGEWAMATLEVCLAIRESARRGAQIALRHQIGVRE